MTGNKRHTGRLLRCWGVTAAGLAATISCGFTWGFGSDPCAAPEKLIPALNGKGPTERAKQEELVLQRCSEKPAADLVNALRHERQGEREKAAEDYRRALRKDPTLAEAHGNLGLLLAQTDSDDEALVELTQGLLAVRDPRYHRALGRLFSQKKLYALARFHYLEALPAFPEDIHLLSGLAQANLDLGNNADAEKEFREILARNRDAREPTLGLVQALRKQRRFDEATALVRKLLLSGGDNKELHRIMGDLDRDQGEMREAEKEYLLAGVKKVIGPEDYLRLGDTLLLARDYAAAVAAYREALKLRPELPSALEKIGDAETAAGDEEEAVAAYRHLLRLRQTSSKTDSSIHYTLGVLYERMGKLDEAVAEYVTAIQLDPSGGDSHRRLADIYTLRGRYGDATEEYRKLIAIRGDNPLIHFKLARVLQKGGDNLEAAVEYAAAIKLDPDNAEAHRELAALLMRTGKIPEAEQEYRRVLRLKKDDRQTRKALVALLVREKKFDEVVAVLGEEADAFPNDPISHYRLGLVQEFRKEYDSALVEYRMAVALKSDFAKALNAIGRVYLRTGDFPKAREALEAAKKADPNLAEARTYLNELKDDSGSTTEKTSGSEKKHPSKKTRKPKRVVKRAGKAQRHHH